MPIIYSLTDPRNNQIRYVGKTNFPKKRFNNHIYNRHVPSPFSEWVKELHSKKLIPVFEELQEVEESEWQFWEQYWIAQTKAWGFTLFNKAIGGRGCVGYRHTPEEKEKISKASKKLWSDSDYRTMMTTISFGINNGFSDKNIYSFWHPIHGEVNSTMVELRHKYNLSDSKLPMLVSGKRFQHQGWRLLKNKDKNKSIHDNNIYHWKHNVHGERFLRKIDLMKEFSELRQDNLCKVIHKVQDSHKGWILNR